MADAPIPSAAPAAPVSDTPQSTGTQAATSSAPAQEAANLQAIQNDPNAPKAVKQEAAKRLKSLKLKIDGREVEEKLPFDIPDTEEAREYMTRQLQMSKVSQKRMGEKAQLEQEVSKFFSELKKNPKATLADPRFGVDVKKLAAEIIEEEIANAQKSPDQLAKEQLERELQKMKDERQKEKDENQKREFERMQQQEFERYDNLMTSALETSDLPKSPYVVKKMADYLMIGLQAGMDVTPQDVLPLVREEILKDISEMAQAMPLDTIEKLFGGDILKQIRTKNVAKTKMAPKGSVKAGTKDVGATKTETKPATPEKITFKKFFGV